MPQPFPFRNRAHEVSRLEAFSDIVFGFALTLIVVSLEVPKNYEELVEASRGFPAFAICFAILIWIWHAHYVFSRRYGLSDTFTIVVNSVLLFVVLFYVYPLKFLFNLVTGAIHLGAAPPSAPRILFAIYGLGFSGIFFLFFLLYSHAKSKASELGLTAIEVHDTQTERLTYGANVVIGLMSMALALVMPRALIQFAGWIYFLLGPAAALIGSSMGSRRRRLEDAMGEAG